MSLKKISKNQPKDFKFSKENLEIFEHPAGHRPPDS